MPRKPSSRPPGCHSCRYYLPDEDGKVMVSEIGICRRYPPMVCGIDEEGNTIQGVPTVESDWICGEYLSPVN